MGNRRSQGGSNSNLHQVATSGNYQDLDGKPILPTLNCSFNEELTGEKWIDGKPIYQKTINFGALPNATQKTVSMGISNVENVFFDFSKSYVKQDSSNLYYVPVLPNVSALANQFYVGASRASVYITSGTDRSGMSAYLTVRYTKITDVGE